MSYSLYAVTAPGLEGALMRELAELGLEARAPRARRSADDGPRDESGGLEFSASMVDLYRANLHLRSAARILVRLGHFEADNFETLRSRAAALNWSFYLAPGRPVALRVTCHKSRLYHSDAVAEPVAGAIGDRLGRQPIVVGWDEQSAELPQLVVVRLANDRCTISIDTSGALLHRRGYRLQTAKAPLRENLAAGILLQSGWDAASPFLDPFCGSGTLPIEAALLARRIAPGKNRRFAFMDWPHFDAPQWKALLAQAVAAELPEAPPIFGSDRDEGAVRIAQANAERAGVAGAIRFERLAVSSIQPPAGPGWVVTNPPYGVRVSPVKDLRDLYSRLGDVLRAACPGWHVSLLCSSDLLAGHTRIRFEAPLPLINGGIAVKLYSGILPTPA
ncbi:MAG: class I SAM-dependent RNA methyltransferase [Anaerolineae bacterium]|nr:class I SAM-dependent RNA methyltransferase [Anaerolineae bacterium]